MITTSTLTGQVWIVDDDEFGHIVENSQRILKLNAQYENHPYVEEFTKERNVMFVCGTYVLEGEAEKQWNLLKACSLPSNTSNFLQANDKLYESVELHTRSISFSPEHRDHQANTQDDDGQGNTSEWKRCLEGGIYKVNGICKLSYFCTSWPY